MMKNQELTFSFNYIYHEIRNILTTNIYSSSLLSSRSYQLPYEYMSKLGHNKTMAPHNINRGRCKIFLTKNIFVKKWLFSVVCLQY